MWCRNASGAGTQELNGRWSTSSVMKYGSVVFSLICLLYSVCSLKVHFWASRLLAAKTQSKTMVITTRFMALPQGMFSKAGNYIPAHFFARRLLALVGYITYAPLPDLTFPCRGNDFRLRPEAKP